MSTRSQIEGSSPVLLGLRRNTISKKEGRNIKFSTSNSKKRSKDYFKYGSRKCYMRIYG
ncbi:17583_t:CDS:2 [Dentiscutata erythropus]|uniref:17583_t:CDS:1 n=1 Tax=Dentiscutata erythropus TaxID=1348616 RepID=A0A9N9BFQ7_9GLOM|nr:17583_t:CDS:2 [Dentiscutata erythropus]